MGVVYLAKDLRLDREVAIKVIAPEVAGDPERLRRFALEARTAAALNHPNIAHVYEIGESEGLHFIAMEYVRGKSLADRIGGRPMAVADVIVYATQIADALDEAHTHGVIHRDLKPANAIISTRGRLKILDFGLAKIVDDARDGDLAGSAGTTNTAAGLVMGTMAYMSPEQIRGLDVDRRTDIFSFGTMLYEMITGRLPFSGVSPTDTVFRITQVQPDPISRHAYDVPPDLDRIARKCLEKEPARRYQSARELLVDLSGLRRDSAAMPAAAVTFTLSRRQRLSLAVGIVATVLVAVSSVALLWRQSDVIDSLAVMPVTGPAANPRAVELTRGVAASIVNSLSLMSSLTLAPRHLSFAAGGNPDPLEDARRFGVHAALILQVEQKGDTAVLLIEMIDLLHDNRLLWSHQVTKNLAEIELAQESISSEIAELINLRLSAEDKREQEVYQLYQRGRTHANKRTEADVRRAIEFFDRAVQKDPNYALAYAGLANGFNLMQTYSWMSPEEAFPAARRAANKALSIDRNLAEAHTQLAWVSFRWDWNWDKAEREFIQAITLNEDHAQARHWMGVFLAAMGRFDEAITRGKEARFIDPLSEVLGAELGWTLYMARRYEESVEESMKARASHPQSYLPFRYLGLAQEQLGRFNDAVNSFSTALRLAGGSSSVLSAELGHAYARAGRQTEASRMLAELLARRSKAYVSSFSLAIINAGLRDVDRTMEWLEIAFREKANLLVWIKVDPRFDFLRSHPRFITLLDEMGFQP